LGLFQVVRRLTRSRLPNAEDIETKQVDGFPV